MCTERWTRMFTAAFVQITKKTGSFENISFIIKVIQLIALYNYFNYQICKKINYSLLENILIFLVSICEYTIVYMDVCDEFI